MNYIMSLEWDNNSPVVFLLYFRTFGSSSIANLQWPRKGEDDVFLCDFYVKSVLSVFNKAVLSTDDLCG